MTTEEDSIQQTHLPLPLTNAFTSSTTPPYKQQAQKQPSASHLHYDNNSNNNNNDDDDNGKLNRSTSGSSLLFLPHPSPSQANIAHTRIQRFDSDNVQHTYPLTLHLRNITIVLVGNIGIPLVLFAVIPLQPLSDYSIT